MRAFLLTGNRAIVAGDLIPQVLFTLYSHKRNEHPMHAQSFYPETVSRIAPKPERCQTSALFNRLFYKNQDGGLELRDNHDGLPEIITTFEQEGQYFGVVQLEQNGKQKRFRLCVDRKGYLALRRILQLRPFDQLPGLKHRYFFVPSLMRLDDHYAMITVRVEQERTSKQLSSKAPVYLAANLMWFWELKDWSQAEYLEEVAFS